MSDHNKITFALKYLPISLLGLWHVTIAELDILLLWQDFIIELKTNSNLRFFGCVGHLKINSWRPAFKI